MQNTFEGYKYVCFDPKFTVNSGQDCTVLSFGIYDEWSFDDEITEKYNCTVRFLVNQR